MTVLVSTLQAQAANLLQDDGGVGPRRWSDSELLGWLNAGQREIVLLRPEISMATAELSLTTGSRQTLPSGSIHLVDVTFDFTYNTSITPVARSVLATNNMEWQKPTAGYGIRHYVYDIRNPLVYWVYPAPTIVHSVEVSRCVEPSEATSAITIPDIFAPVLLNYMVYRALSKDSETAIHPAAAAHYQAFQSLVTGAQAYRPADPAATPGNAAFNPDTPQ